MAAAQQPSVIRTKGGFHKLLGVADDNSATDITALLNMVDSVATTTGAAVVLAGHFAKGNASTKETLDRISGSGVFARDPDSLVVFTRHEEEGAFVVEMVLRNLPPVAPFVVRWRYPLFRREDGLDPTRLKSMGGRPAQYTAETLLDCLGNDRLSRPSGPGIGPNPRRRTLQDRI